jgi:6-phosphogluconolactonase (cycloisomerase 2 family)
MTRLFPRKNFSRFGVIAALVALTRSADTVNKSNAEIALSHDGRFVYVEDRGENELVVYRVDQNS